MPAEAGSRTGAGELGETVMKITFVCRPICRNLHHENFENQFSGENFENQPSEESFENQ
jgi:hypothetical protein